MVRARHGCERFGRNDLTEEELKLVCNDNLLWMRTMWVAVQAYEANKNLEIILEQPQDPEQWKQPPSEVKEKIPGWNGLVFLQDVGDIQSSFDLSLYGEVPE